MDAMDEQALVRRLRQAGEQAALPSPAWPRESRRVESSLETRPAELAGAVSKPMEIKPGEVREGVVVEMLPGR